MRADRLPPRDSSMLSRRSWTNPGKVGAWAALRWSAAATYAIRIRCCGLLRGKGRLGLRRSGGAQVGGVLRLVGGIPITGKRGEGLVPESVILAHRRLRGRLLVEKSCQGDVEASDSVTGRGGSREATVRVQK